MMNRCPGILTVFAVALLLSGCGKESNPQDGERTADAWDRTTRQAESLAAKGQYDQAERLWKDSINQAKQFGEADHRLVVSYARLADCYRAKSDNAQAESTLRMAIAVDEKRSVPPDLTSATALTDLGDVLAAGGRFKEAEPLYQRALKLLDTMPGDKQVVLIDAYEDYANTLHGLHRDEEAALMTEKADQVRHGSAPISTQAPAKTEQ